MWAIESRRSGGLLLLAPGSSTATEPQVPRWETGKELLTEEEPSSIFGVPVEMNALRVPAKLALVVLLATGCVQRVLQVPVPYRVRADAGPATLSCARMELTDLGFVFTEEPAARNALGQRGTGRGSRENALEFVRLELSGEGNRQVLQLTIGTTNRRSILEPDALPLEIGSLASPSRQSIEEVDELMARCQRPPFSVSMGG